MWKCCNLDKYKDSVYSLFQLIFNFVLFDGKPPALTFFEPLQYRSFFIRYKLNQNLKWTDIISLSYFNQFIEQRGQCIVPVLAGESIYQALDASSNLRERFHFRVTHLLFQSKNHLPSHFSGIFIFHYVQLNRLN